MSTRYPFLIGLLICIAVLVTAIYWFDIRQGLEPCPLCIFQRVAFIALGVVMLLATLHGPRGWGRRVYGLLGILAAGTGAAIAGRHVWLQNLPKDKVPECGPGLEYLRDTFPLSKVIETVLSGSGECADVQWQFLGLSMPAWTLVIFVCFVVAGCYFLFASTPHSRDRLVRDRL